MTRRNVNRSGCPLNASVEVLGDRWTLIVLRDIAFGDRRTFNELQHNSMEKIASNILAERLRSMVDAGLLTREPDPTHSQRVVYHLTEASIALVPVMVELGMWAHRFLQPDPAMSARILTLNAGGDQRIATFQDELRLVHQHNTDRVPIHDQPTAAILEAAYHDAGGT